MAVDDVLFQIETDKVTIDVRAPEAGVMEDVMVRLSHACIALDSAPIHTAHEHHVIPMQVKEDDTVTVGQVIAKIGAGEASSSKEPSPPQQEPPAKQPEAAPASEPSGPSLLRLTAYLSWHLSCNG